MSPVASAAHTPFIPTTDHPRSERKTLDERRYHAFNLRLTSGELQRLQALARESSQSASDVVRFGIHIGCVLQDIHRRASGLHLQPVLRFVRQRVTC